METAGNDVAAPGRPDGLGEFVGLINLPRDRKSDFRSGRQITHLMLQVTRRPLKWLFESDLKVKSFWLEAT